MLYFKQRLSRKVSPRFSQLLICVRFLPMNLLCFLEILMKTGPWRVSWPAPITLSFYILMSWIALSEALKADHGFNVESRAIRDLVETMSEYNPLMRRAYLQFITGSPKLPIGGESQLLLYVYHSNLMDELARFPRIEPPTYCRSQAPWSTTDCRRLSSQRNDMRKLSQASGV